MRSRGVGLGAIVVSAFLAYAAPSAAVPGAASLARGCYGPPIEEKLFSDDPVAVRREAKPSPGVVVTRVSHFGLPEDYSIRQKDKAGALTVDYRFGDGGKLAGMVLEYESSDGKALNGILKLSLRREGEYGLYLDLYHPDQVRYGEMQAALDSSAPGGSIAKRALSLEELSRRMTQEADALRSWDGCGAPPIDLASYQALFNELKPVLEPMLYRYKDNAKGAMQESLRRAKDALKKLLPDSRRP